MKTVKLDYGDKKVDIDMPESTFVVEYGKTYTDPNPVGDQIELTRKALENPLGFPPLQEMAGPDKKAAIGFPDRVKGGAHAKAHRRVAINLVLEKLLAGGCKIENISLLCCEGLHRMNTIEEWYWYLGKEIVDQFLPDRIHNHDAEAPDLLNFAKDDMGNVIQCNRLLGEADIPIVIGHVAGNPYGGYSGGYKMIVTGMSGWQSIGSHHCPSTMHRTDWLGADTSSHMRKQFRSIGRAMEKGIGKKIFAVDAVLGQFADVLDVQAGQLSAVEEATWPLADKRTNIVVDIPEAAEVLIMGIPRNFHYGPGMGTNPILMSLAIGGQLSRCWHAFWEGGVIIALSICDGWFNDLWFPSYKETYEAMLNYATPIEFLDSSDAADIVNNYEYRFRYSNDYTYHPFHAMSMISGGAIPAQRCSAVYVVGAKKPGYARGVGFSTLPTVQEALKAAERYVGKNPRILCTPECFSGGARFICISNKYTIDAIRENSF